MLLVDLESQGWTCHQNVRSKPYYSPRKSRIIS